MTTGRELADQGQADTLAAATVAHITHLDDLRDALDHCIDHSAGATALWGNGFTAEDVRDRLTPECCAWCDEHPNVLPALFAAASRLERIRVVGYRAPTRPSRRGNNIRIWKATRSHRDRAA